MSIVNSESVDGPLPLRWAVLGLWVQAALVVAVGVFTVVEVFVAEPTSPGVAMVLGLATIGLGVVLYRLGVLLTQRRSWPRGAAIACEFMALPVAFFMMTGGAGVVVTIVGAVLGVYCLTCAALLLAPATRQALR